jgi:hypothetical protein
MLVGSLGEIIWVKLPINLFLVRPFATITSRMTNKNRLIR